MRHNDLKLIYSYESESWELYDLRTDAAEIHNLAEEQPRTVARLGGMLVDWLVGVDAQLPIDRRTGIVIPLPVVPELGPIDFDLDGDVDVEDIDALVAEIFAGTGNTGFDVSGDNVVDQNDLTTWLSDAAEHNGFTQVYLAGDTNLNGMVDAGDLNDLALNWRHNIALWSAGDFNADGNVDAADLNSLALNWRRSIPIPSAVRSTVPEPSAWALMLFGLASVWRRPFFPKRATNRVGFRVGE